MKKTVEQFIEELRKYPKGKFIKVHVAEDFAYYDPELEYIGDDQVTIYADR